MRATRKETFDWWSAGRVDTRSADGSVVEIVRLDGIRSHLSDADREVHRELPDRDGLKRAALATDILT